MIARRLRRNRRSERGSVLVEMVIAAPVILFISLAVLDVGLGWRTSLTVSNAVRSGARVASNLGQSTEADASTLKAVGAALGSIPVAEVDVVVVFDPPAGDPEVPAACLTDAAIAAGGSHTHRCNVYSGEEVEAVVNGSPSAPVFGDCTTRHQFWCPSNRDVAQASTSGLDRVGVYVRIDHKNVTKALGPNMVIDETAVMVMEPGAGDDS